MEDIPLFADTDVLVCGAGPAGFAAAIAAARGGAKTMLIEKYGFPGGMLTGGYVNPIYGFFARHIQVVQGIAQEFIDELLDIPGGTTGHRYRHDCISHRSKYGECLTGRDEKTCPVASVARVCAVDSEFAKIVMIRMLKSAGVICYYHLSVVRVDADGEKISGVVVQGKSGLRVIRAQVVIDATGDADVVAQADLAYRKGSEAKNLMKPPTLMFKISGVKATHDRIRVELPETKPGEESFGWLMALPEDGEYTVNAPSGLIGFDSTDSEKLSAGQEYATEAMFCLYHWLKENHPACGEIKLKGIAPQIGIRDSRRIVGGYTLTEYDILLARKFPGEGIANGVHPIDLHISDDEFNNQHLVTMRCGDYYQIPYACLVPKGANNFLVAGRSISATFLAQGSLRVRATCMATGQAAGTAAIMGLFSNLSMSEVPAKDIQKRLRKQGAGIGDAFSPPDWNLGLAALPDEIKKKAYHQGSKKE
jgi:ribulose 1,5-bisphosphate synthetase/thiazole synthase